MANIKVEPHSPLLPSQENFPGNSSGSNQCPSPASSELQTIMVAWVKKKLISKIKQFCDRFQAGFTEGIFYDFDMEIDVAELLESNGNSKVIFKMISDKRWLNIEAASQILINPKFINLPTLSECMPTGRLPCIEGLMKIAGTVVGFTPIHEYTKGTKYNCTQEELCMSNACDNIFSWLPGIFEYDIVRPGRRCKQCYASMEEDVKFRKLADDLVNRMKIGHDYWITGVVIREPMRRTASQQFYDTVLEACDIVEKTNLEFSFSENFKYAKMIAVKKNDCTEDLPDSIRSLYEESICIGGSFHKLKLALLLSSVLSGNDLLVEDINGKLVIGNELQRINILCISDDVGKLQRLFTYASSVCDKAVLSQQNLDLFGSVTKKHEADTHVHIDGDQKFCQFVGEVRARETKANCRTCTYKWFSDDVMERLEQQSEDFEYLIASKKHKAQCKCGQAFFEIGENKFKEREKSQLEITIERRMQGATEDAMLEEFVDTWIHSQSSVDKSINRQQNATLQFQNATPRPWQD
eukprot:gene17253-8814_t